MRESMMRAAGIAAGMTAFGGGVSQEAMAQQPPDKNTTEHIADQHVYTVADGDMKEMWDKIDRGEYVTRPDATPPPVFFTSDEAQVKAALASQDLVYIPEGGKILSSRSQTAGDSIEWAYATYDKAGKLIVDTQGVYLSLEQGNEKGVVVTTVNNDLTEDIAVFENGKMVSGHHYVMDLPKDFATAKPK